MKTTRRDALKIGLSSFAAGLAAQARAAGPGRAANDNLFVAIELSGGNDALNTVIPLDDPAYHAARPTLALDGGLHLDGRHALHPALPALKQRFDADQIAIVHGCGYPGMIRSHYRSMEIWQSASLQPGPAGGWLGRCPTSARADGAYIGQEPPLALIAPAGHAYPTCLGQELNDAALDRLALALGASHRVGFVTLPGFDTHVDQLRTHASALRRLDRAVERLMSHFTSRGMSRRLLIMIYSEFSRRVQENGLGGTDHGGAGTMLICGPAVRGGIYGQFPSLSDLDDGDQRYTTDFRRVYATILDRWLGADTARVLDASFAPIDFL